MKSGLYNIQIPVQDMGDQISGKICSFVFMHGARIYAILLPLPPPVRGKDHSDSGEKNYLRDCAVVKNKRGKEGKNKVKNEKWGQNKKVAKLV